VRAQVNHAPSGDQAEGDCGIAASGKPCDHRHQSRTASRPPPRSEHPLYGLNIAQVLCAVEPTALAPRWSTLGELDRFRGDLA